jgi:hypothetical protein
MRIRQGWSMIRIALVLLCAVVAQACTVPVFAYALRRWEPDAHHLAWLADAATRTQLQQEAEAAFLNLVVEEGKERTSLSHRALTEPWWTGEVTPALRQHLLRSPLRDELVRLLASGETAVWLFVPSGDAAADATARAMLVTRLEYLKGVVQLPTMDDGDQATATTMEVPGPAVRLSFQVRDLRLDDPVEWVLAAQVRAMDPKATGPRAVPVYGRARALDILSGETLSESVIDEVVGFLSGACSCQVKELNPGWDLLAACDWWTAMEAAAAAQPQEPLPPAPQPETVVIGAPAAAPAQAQAQAAAPAPAAAVSGASAAAPSSSGIAVGVALAVVALVLVVFLIVVATRSGANKAD